MNTTAIHTETEDRQIVKSVLDKAEKPKAFLNYVVDFSEDSSGDPAAWVKIKVDEKKALANIEAINSFARKLQRAILEEGATRWPYVIMVTTQPHKTTKKSLLMPRKAVKKPTAKKK